jgi:hypothetical protein
MEFRCFIKDHRVIAISQRDDTVCYPHLVSSQAALFEELNSFLALQIIPYLPWDRCTFGFASFDFLGVVDLYFAHSGKRYIVDIGAWDERETGSILFEWEELNKLAQTEDGRPDGKSDGETDDKAVFRIVESDNDCRLGMARYNSLPVEMQDSGTSLDRLIRESTDK